MLTSEEGGAGAKIRRLEDCEEAVGLLHKVQRCDQEILLTFMHRQTVRIDFSPKLFEELLELQGRDVAILCLGNNIYKFRITGGKRGRKVRE